MSNYCKVCFDAKKSKTVYTSHRVRNASGVVMCPTLLSQECNYCKKPGHTLSHCPALKGKYNKYQPSPLRKEQKNEGVEERKNEERKNEERNADKRIEERKNEERKKKNENDTRAEYYQRQDLQRRAAQLCRSPSPPPDDDFPIVGAKNGGPRFISAANAAAPLKQWASIVVKQAQQEEAQAKQQAKQQEQEAKQQQQAKQQEQQQAKQQQAKQHEEEDEDSSDDEQPQQAKQPQPQHRVVLSWADMD